MARNPVPKRKPSGNGTIDDDVDMAYGKIGDAANQVGAAAKSTITKYAGNFIPKSGDGGLRINKAERARAERGNTPRWRESSGPGWQGKMDVSGEGSTGLRVNNAERKFQPGDSKKVSADLDATYKKTSKKYGVSGNK